MLVLGIETSCDETGAALVRDRTHVLSNVVASQFNLHEEYAGVVPELASRAHVEAIIPAVREALAEAGVGLGMIDAIAVGHRPGLIGSLLVGVAAAKSLAWSLEKPLIGVDHVHAHLYSGVLDVPDALGSHGDAPLFPALGLVVSGGHTAMYRVESWSKVTRLGATIDDAIGEAFDKAATILGIAHPGGPNLDALAQRTPKETKVVDLPISRLSSTSLDFSFSGLKTALLYEARGVPGPRGSAAPPMSPERVGLLAASFQRAAVKSISLKLDRAIAHTPGYRSLVCGGGVSANSLLRETLQRIALANNMRLVLPPLHYCTDNAAMIAGLGAALLECGAVSGMDLQAQPTSAL